jgi:anaerobic dimethyl sulfoxide reductase subunit A
LNRYLTFYTGCNVNCGGGSCVLKVHCKDGRIIAIEPDDRYNRNLGREDEVMSKEDFIKNHLQQRGCAKSYCWDDVVYSSNRVLYPLKRREDSKRGEGKFQRISWEEALTLVAQKLMEYKEKHGPYSILVPYMFSPVLQNFLGHLGAGVQGWGWCSDDAGRLALHLVLGHPGFTPWAFHDMADMLMNTKLIILLGADPTTAHWGPGHQYAWYILLAKEKRDVPVIVIDPVYTAAAEVLADQWIPIKPGSDMALMAAIAYVLFSEDLYNREFVKKWVEPKGFQMWKDYIMGKQKTSENPDCDGIPKTPEWAEKITGIPAETIYGLARLYAKSKPTYLLKNWSVSRKAQGVNIARACIYLQAMMGYIGAPGGHVSLFPVAAGNRLPLAISLPMGDFPDKTPPTMYRSTKWAQAILLLEKVERGEMSTEEYRRIIGWRAPQELPNPNPKMLIQIGPFEVTTNYLVTSADSTNDQLKALEKLEFIVTFAEIMTPTAKYSDVIFPVADLTFEGSWHPSTYSYSNVANVVYSPRPLPPRGESKPLYWILTKLAEKCGFRQRFNKYYTTDENWDIDWERYISDCYSFYVIPQIESCVNEHGGRMDKPLPSWEEFKKMPIINVDEFFHEPWHAFVEEINRGRGFETNSGKIEFYAEALADESRRCKGEHYDTKRRIIDGLPCDWRELRPLAVYQPLDYGMDDPLVIKYPLLLLTPHSRYRVHSFLWDCQSLRGVEYSHAIWISVADAVKRGIKDRDLVRVYNERGETLLPAYVTSRIMPGVVLIRHGAYYHPDEHGRDLGGCATVLLHNNRSMGTPAHVTTLVEVEKIG